MPLRVTTTAIAYVAVLFLETAKSIAGKKMKNLRKSIPAPPSAIRKPQTKKKRRNSDARRI